MRMIRGLLAACLVLLLVGVGPLAAQDDLAAALEVLNAGVEVMRVGTTNWVPVRMESIVGVGDTIRTDATGQARITFFADGTFVELESDTTYRIIEFSGDGDIFTLSVEVLVGITVQQFARLLDPGSSYAISTPGMAMTVRGTAFSIRVENNGRSALLTSEGRVEATGAGATSLIEPGFGVRSEVGAPLSDVVAATTFEELDAALDGCAGVVTATADVMLNVRTGPGETYTRLGALDASEINLLMAVDANGDWYRIPYNSGFGWVSAAVATVDVEAACPGLRVYSGPVEESLDRYTATGPSAVSGVVIVRTRQGIDAVNLRAGPGQDFTILDVLADGDEVIALGRTADGAWLRILTLDGQLGWVSSDLIQSRFDLAGLSALPVGVTTGQAVPAPVEATATAQPTVTAQPGDGAGASDGSGDS